MKVTFFGTTTLLFDDGTHQILFDALLSRPSLWQVAFGKLTTNRALVDSLLSRFQINRLQGVFVSHSHHDHAMDAPYVALQTGATVYGSESTRNIALGGGVTPAHTAVFHPNEQFAVGKFRITVLPSVHSEAHLYNNNLGQAIEAPLRQPARVEAYKEGGSFDFLIEHDQRTYLIHPCFNYLEGVLDQVRADVLFLNVSGLSKASAERQAAFFDHTVRFVDPKLIVPIHWDQFFLPLTKPVQYMPHFTGTTGDCLRCLVQYCADADRRVLLQLPLTSAEL